MPNREVLLMLFCFPCLFGSYAAAKLAFAANRIPAYELAIMNCWCDSLKSAAENRIPLKVVISVCIPTLLHNSWKIRQALNLTYVSQI